MKETTPSAMPPCLDRWCGRCHDVFTHKAQKTGFRQYLGGLLGESERKNLTQILKDAVGVTYHQLHHFLTETPWQADQVNGRHLQVMQQCSQTKVRKGFSLIIDDSGHRKSGTLTAGVGRQYIGEIGKTDNRVVVVTTHLYDGVKSLPLNVELYRHASSLPQGKQDSEFIKKPDIALKLIDKYLERGERPGVVLIDAGYGNNSKFLRELESRKLTYIGGLAKHRKAIYQQENQEKKSKKNRLDELAKNLNPKAFTEIKLNYEKPRNLWVATLEVELSTMSYQFTMNLHLI